MITSSSRKVHDGTNQQSSTGPPVEMSSDSTSKAKVHSGQPPSYVLPDSAMRASQPGPPLTDAS